MIQYDKKVVFFWFIIVFFIFSRRLDPYERSCRILASLFAIGFVLIIIIVLSLIPIYISQKSSTTTNTIQTTSKHFLFKILYRVIKKVLGTRYHFEVNNRYKIDFLGYCWNCTRFSRQVVNRFYVMPLVSIRRRSAITILDQNHYRNWDQQ